MTRAIWAVLALCLGAQPGAVLAQRLYVANQDEATVSIIDIASQRVVETVDFTTLGFARNARPHHVQVERDGSAWYVTLIGAGRVLKLDRANRIVGAVPMEVPGLIALHPSADLMFVARSMSAVNPPPRMLAVRRSDMTVVEEIDVFFPRPHALVADPLGRRVFVASIGANQIASVDAESFTVRVVDVAGGAKGMVQGAVSSDGHWLAITAELADSLLVFDVSAPAGPTLARTIAMADGPFEPVFTYDGQYLIVTNLNANTVQFVRTRDWEVEATVSHPAFAQPHGLALSPDGQYVFVSNRHQSGGVHDHEGGKAMGKGNVVAICIATRAIAAVLDVGAYAAGMGAPAPMARPSPPAGACR